MHVAVFPALCVWLSLLWEQEAMEAECPGPAIHGEQSRFEKVNLVSPPSFCLICADH